MISDVLHDSVLQIRRYLDGTPDYEERPRIEALLVEMNAIRAILDTPPTKEEIEAFDAKLEAEHARTGADEIPCSECRANRRAPLNARCRHCGWQSTDFYPFVKTKTTYIDVKTVDSDRAAFEGRAFYLRTLSGDSPDRGAYFARVDNDREYKDPVVAAMWWAWRESRIVAAMPALPEPDPFETNKWQEWANEAHSRRVVVDGKVVKDNYAGRGKSKGNGR